MNIFKIINAVCLGIGFLLGVSAQDYNTCGQNEHLIDPPECPSFEEMPTYFSYPYDCTKYFECTNGDARCIQCPDGTRWDQNLTTCNHAAAIDCVFATTRPTLTTPETTVPTTTTPIITEDPAEWICEKDYEGPIGHPFDCTHFYICGPERMPCLFACTEDHYWSPITKECEWKWDVPYCQGGTPPPPTTRSSITTNYRNFNRFNGVGFVASLLKRKAAGEDPCEQ